MKIKTKKIILGIDPGIADTGFGIIEQYGTNLKSLGYGSIKTSKLLSLPERILILEKELSKIIKEYKPDLISVEQLFFCNNSKTALVVGQARGIVLLKAAQNNIPLKEFTPLQVKQAVCGYGQAEKSQIQKIVKIILKLDELPKPDDAADALAIAICSATNF
ncbi:MAG: crossover junction endodeoxyribonuclease RuvC [Candidatus Buchananbacteria bacterium]